MSITCTNREGLEKMLRDNLKQSRYEHSLGVEEMASELAEIHGADVEKAAFAGRYHDLAKYFDNHTTNLCIRKYDIDRKFLGNPALAHSKIAAAILEHEFGVTDEDILNAVKSHTTGRVGMSLLEEIVYVADAIEKNRNYPELKQLQDEARINLDLACYHIMNYAVQMIMEKGNEIDEDTLLAREFIKERLKVI